MNSVGPELLDHVGGDLESLSSLGRGGSDVGLTLSTEPEKQKYLAVVPEIGLRFISKEMKGKTSSGNLSEDFVKDHRSFMIEIGQGGFKIPTIGGGPLDIAKLFVEVMKRGGVQRVIDTRAFKMIARNLDLPATCTSAAYVLRVSYERILYFYEQQFVFGRDPKNAPPVHQLNQSRKDDGRMSLPIAGTPVPPGVTSDPRLFTPTNSRDRPKRKAAETASNAVAMSAGSPMNGSVTPSTGTRSRRGRPPSSEKAALEAAAAAASPRSSFEERLREDFSALERPADAIFNPEIPQERERIVLCLACGVREQVAWALGTMNALSFDSRRNCLIRDFPGLLDALVMTLQRYFRDTERMRESGLHPDEEARWRSGPRMSVVSGVDVEGTPNGAGAWRMEATLQFYGGDLFNALDPVVIDLEERAAVASNILRNLSFIEKNCSHIGECSSLHEIASRMILSPRIALEMRENLLDMWLNAASHFCVAENAAAEKVLPSLISALDPFLPGADTFLSRFSKSAEILSKLAANVDRNEAAITASFDVLLPRLVDMLGGKERRYVAAGVAALCNISAFDWPARGKVARTPRCIGRLIAMLKDPELAPRAALTLHNLAEAPNNRGVLMSFERELVEKAMEPGPAADTVASLLYEFTAD